MSEVCNVIVCGGRTYTDKAKIYQALDLVMVRVEQEEGLTLRVLFGDAKGVDAIACTWACERRKLFRVYAADWEHEGKAAGPLRNQRMLDQNLVWLVVAFQGGRGTADMVRRAKAKAIQVWFPATSPTDDLPPWILSAEGPTPYPDETSPAGDQTSCDVSS